MKCDTSCGLTARTLKEGGFKEINKDTLQDENKELDKLLMK